MNDSLNEVSQLIALSKHEVHKKNVINIKNYCVDAVVNYGVTSYNLMILMPKAYKSLKMLINERK